MKDCTNDSNATNCEPVAIFKPFKILSPKPRGNLFSGLFKRRGINRAFSHPEAPPRRHRPPHRPRCSSAQAWLEGLEFRSQNPSSPAINPWRFLSRGGLVLIDSSRTTPLLRFANIHSFTSKNFARMFLPHHHLQCRHRSVINANTKRAASSYTPKSAIVDYESSQVLARLWKSLSPRKCG